MISNNIQESIINNKDKNVIEANNTNDNDKKSLSNSIAYSSAREKHINKAALINKAVKERKDYENKIQIMVNRLNRLKKIEQEAEKKLNNLKTKIITEEKCKIYKQEVQKELSKVKKMITEESKQKHNYISKKKIKEKRVSVKRRSQFLESKELNYQQTKNNKHLICDLLNQVKSHELGLKAHNVNKIKEIESKTKTEKRIIEMEKEKERKMQYENKVEEALKKCESIKKTFSQLESIEHDAVEKTNNLNKTFVDVEKEVAENLRSSVHKVLLKSNNIFIDDNIENKLRKVVNKIGMKTVDCNISLLSGINNCVTENNNANICTYNKITNNGISNTVSHKTNQQKYGSNGFSYIRDNTSISNNLMSSKNKDHIENSLLNKQNIRTSSTTVVSRKISQQNTRNNSTTNKSVKSKNKDFDFTNPNNIPHKTKLMESLYNESQKIKAQKQARIIKEKEKQRLENIKKQRDMKKGSINKGNNYTTSNSIVNNSNKTNARKSILKTNSIKNTDSIKNSNFNSRKSESTRGMYKKSVTQENLSKNNNSTTNKVRNTMIVNRNRNSNAEISNSSTNKNRLQKKLTMDPSLGNSKNRLGSGSDIKSQKSNKSNLSNINSNYYTNRNSVENSLIEHLDMKNNEDCSYLNSMNNSINNDINNNRNSYKKITSNNTKNTKGSVFSKKSADYTNKSKNEMKISVKLNNNKFRIVTDNDDIETNKNLESDTKKNKNSLMNSLNINEINKSASQDNKQKYYTNSARNTIKPSAQKEIDIISKKLNTNNANKRESVTKKRNSIDTKDIRTNPIDKRKTNVNLSSKASKKYSSEVLNEKKDSESKNKENNKKIVSSSNNNEEIKS